MRHHDATRRRAKSLPLSTRAVPSSQGRMAMPLSASIRTQIGTLVIATSVIQLANGFFGTFVSLRVAIENFTASGLVLSAYFGGFTLGALRCSSIIERIGHIRSYAAFAAC